MKGNFRLTYFIPVIIILTILAIFWSYLSKIKDGKSIVKYSCLVMQYHIFKKKKNCACHVFKSLALRTSSGCMM